MRIYNLLMLLITIYLRCFHLALVAFFAISFLFLAERASAVALPPFFSNAIVPTHGAKLFPVARSPPTSEVLPFGLVLNRASDYPCPMSDERHVPNQGGSSCIAHGARVS